MNEEWGYIGFAAQFVYWAFLLLMGFAIGRKWEKIKRKEPGMYCTLLKNSRVIMTREEYNTLHEEAVKGPKKAILESLGKGKTVAVDFDGTICGEQWEINPWLIDTLAKAQKNGTKLILYTSREGASLDWAVEFCAAIGLKFDRVIGGKPVADVYLGDKAVKAIWPVEF